MFSMRGAMIREKIVRDGYVMLESFLKPEECDELIAAGADFTYNLPSANERAIFSFAHTNVLAEQKYLLQSNDKIMPFFERKAIDVSGAFLVPPTISLYKIGHALHLQNPVFRSYTYGNAVESLCMELKLRSPAVVQSQFYYKNTGNGGVIHQHQDANYIYTSPIPVYGFWISLADSTVENGCLRIIKGSHRSGVYRRWMRDLGPDSNMKLLFDRPPISFQEIQFTPVPAKKGSVIILHGHVIYKSAGNKSKKPCPAYHFNIIEKTNNKYYPENWLQQGKQAPFLNFYNTTPQDFSLV